MKFFESLHCRSLAHCGTCRDKEKGRGFRQQIRRSFSGIDSDDFDCPLGVEWRQPKPRVAADFFLMLYKEIVNESKNDWLIKMAVQCKAMYDNPPKGITCRDKAAFRRRWYEKLKFYRNESLKQKVDNVDN